MYLAPFSWIMLPSSKSTEACSIYSDRVSFLHAACNHLCFFPPLFKPLSSNKESVLVHYCWIRQSLPKYLQHIISGHPVSLVQACYGTAQLLIVQSPHPSSSHHLLRCLNFNVPGYVHEEQGHFSVRKEALL